MGAPRVRRREAFSVPPLATAGDYNLNSAAPTGCMEAVRGYMSARWARRDSDRPRPEDAASYEARRRFVAAAIPGNPARTVVTTMLILFVTLVLDVLCWDAFAHRAGSARWAWFGLALLFLGLCLWSLGRLALYYARMFKRYIQLSKLNK